MPFLRPLEYYDKRFHEKQLQAWLAYKAGLTLVLDWGRRSGKSELEGEIFVEDVEENGKDCMFCALTQTQGREIMWPKWEKLIGGKRDWKPNESRLEWKHKPSGAIISIKGFDQGVDKLRGNAKRLIALDEWAFLKQKVKKKGKGRPQLLAEPTLIKEVFAPQLVDYAGQFIYSSTPKGKNHFWKLKQKAMRESGKFFTSHCTMFENPFLSDRGREILIDEYDGPNDPLYRQEVMAEYIVLEGIAFALPPDSYIVDRWDPADLEFSWHWRGMDHGYSPDPTAALWFAYNKRKGYTLVYSEYRHPQLLIKQHADAIQGQEPYRVVQTLSDLDPQVIAEYSEVGLELSEAGKHDKESRILRIVNALRMGRLKIARNCTKLLDEMSVYEWYQDGSDDLVDALNYGWNNFTIPEEPAREPPREPGRRDIAVEHGQEFGY